MEKEAKKAKSEPKAFAKAEPKSYPVVSPVQMHRGPGFNPVLMPPMAVDYKQMPFNHASMPPGDPMAMPKGNKASSSGAAGAQKEDYDEVPTASAAVASETIPAPTQIVTDPGSSQTLPSTSAWSEGHPGAPVNFKFVKRLGKLCIHMFFSAP